MAFCKCQWTSLVEVIILCICIRAAYGDDLDSSGDTENYYIYYIVHEPDQISVPSKNDTAFEDSSPEQTDGDDLNVPALAVGMVSLLVLIIVCGIAWVKNRKLAKDNFKSRANHGGLREYSSGAQQEHDFILKDGYLELVEFESLRQADHSSVYESVPDSNSEEELSSRSTQAGETSDGGYVTVDGTEATNGHAEQKYNDYVTVDAENVVFTFIPPEREPVLNIYVKSDGDGSMAGTSRNPEESKCSENVSSKSGTPEARLVPSPRDAPSGDDGAINTSKPKLYNKLSRGQMHSNDDFKAEESVETVADTRHSQGKPLEDGPETGELTTVTGGQSTISQSPYEKVTGAFFANAAGDSQEADPTPRLPLARRSALSLEILASDSRVYLHEDNMAATGTHQKEQSVDLVRSSGLPQNGDRG